MFAQGDRSTGAPGAPADGSDSAVLHNSTVYIGNSTSGARTPPPPPLHQSSSQLSVDQSNYLYQPAPLVVIATNSSPASSQLLSHVIQSDSPQLLLERLQAAAPAVTNNERYLEAHNHTTTASIPSPDNFVDKPQPHLPAAAAALLSNLAAGPDGGGGGGGGSPLGHQTASGRGPFTSYEWLMIVTLVSIILISIVGNLLVCVAIFTDRRLRKLGNAFIVSLAIADLFVSFLVMTFALHNDLMDEWTFGPWFCDIWISFDIMCCTASILNLCAISLDRFIHIKDCLLYNQLMTRRVAISAVIMIWIISALVSFVPINLGWHKPSRLPAAGDGAPTRSSSSLSPATLAMIDFPGPVPRAGDSRDLDASGEAKMPLPPEAGLSAPYRPQLPGSAGTHTSAENDDEDDREASSRRPRLRGDTNSSEDQQQQQQWRRRRQKNENQQRAKRELLVAKTVAAPSWISKSISETRSGGGGGRSEPPQPLRSADKLNYSAGAARARAPPPNEPIGSGARPPLDFLCLREEEGGRDEAARPRGSHGGGGGTSPRRKCQVAPRASGAREPQLLHMNKLFATVYGRHQVVAPAPVDAAPPDRAARARSQLRAAQLEGAKSYLVRAGPASNLQRRQVDSTQQIKARGLLSGGATAAAKRPRRSQPAEPLEQQLPEEEEEQEEEQAVAASPSREGEGVARGTPLRNNGRPPASSRSHQAGELDDYGEQTGEFSDDRSRGHSTATRTSSTTRLVGGAPTSAPAAAAAAEPAQCMLTLTPTYAVISSTISFYIPCLIMLGLYSRLFACARRHVRNIKAISRAPHPISVGAATAATDCGGGAAAVSSNTQHNKNNGATSNSLEQSAGLAGRAKRLIGGARAPGANKTNNARESPSGSTHASKEREAASSSSSESRKRLARLVGGGGGGGGSGPTHGLFGSRARTWIKFRAGGAPAETKKNSNSTMIARGDGARQDSDCKLALDQRQHQAGAHENSDNNKQAPTAARRLVLKSILSGERKQQGPTTNSQVDDDDKSGPDGGHELEPFLAASGKHPPPQSQQEATGPSPMAAAAGDQNLKLTSQSTQQQFQAQQQARFQQQQQAQRTKQQTNTLDTHKAAITLGIIMGTFLLCWLPFFCLNIIKAFHADLIPVSLFRASTWLGYANSALNPIIYGIHNSEFRNAFNRIFFKHLTLKNGRQYLNRRFSYDFRAHQAGGRRTSSFSNTQRAQQPNLHLNLYSSTASPERVLLASGGGGGGGGPLAANKHQTSALAKITEIQTQAGGNEQTQLVELARESRQQQQQLQTNQVVHRPARQVGEVQDDTGRAHLTLLATTTTSTSCEEREQCPANRVVDCLRQQDSQFEITLSTGTTVRTANQELRNEIVATSQG